MIVVVARKPSAKLQRTLDAHLARVGRWVWVGQAGGGTRGRLLASASGMSAESAVAIWKEGPKGKACVFAGSLSRAERVSIQAAFGIVDYIDT